MGAIGIIAHYSKLKDVSFVRTDLSPPQQGDAPSWETSASRLFMGPGGGAFSLGVSDLGTTAGDTGVTGTRLVLAGIGRITLSQSTDAAGGTITISGGTAGAGAFSAGVSDIGNSLGDTGVTGTRMVLSGGGVITLSQQTDVGGATVGFSAPPQSAQTQNRFNLTLAGNTAGVLQEVSSGTLTLAGGPNITVSQNGNAITISGVGSGTGAQTVQTLGLFADGNTLGESTSTTRDARSVSLRGEGAVSVGFSGGSIRISAPTQSVQPETQTFVGGVAASDATYTSGTVQLLGAGAATVRSTTGQGIQISVPVQSVQPETQTFVAGVGNSQTTYSSGTVRLSELGAVTIRSTTGQALQISVNPQSVQPETQTFLGGLAGSNTTYTSGTVTIVGSGDITVSSGTGQRIIISGSQSVQTVGLYANGNTTGQSSSSTFDARTISLRGDGAVSVGYSNGTVRISAPVQSVQPETQTFVGGIAGSDTTYTSGTVRFTGVGGGITVSSNTGQRIDLSVAAQTVQTQDRFDLTISGNTSGAGQLVSSGTLSLAGGNNITLSQAGNAITISGANAAGAQTAISGLANSETTYSSGTVKLSELGAITIRSTTGQQFQLSVDPQSAQTVGMYALGNTTGESSSTTMDARTISLRGDGIVSVGYSNGSLRISASQSVQPETQTFIAGLANSQTTYTSGTVSLSELGAITIRSTTGNQFQLSVNPQSVQPGIQNLVASNTTFSSGTVSISGFGAATVNTAANIIRISVPVQTVESQSIGMSNIGNTSGTTGIASGAQVRMLFAGGNNVTLSQSLNGASGTLTISAANQTVQTQNVVDVTLSGNTAGVQALISSGTMTLAGGNNITVSQNGNAVTISGPNVGGAQTGISGFIASDATYTSGTVEITGSGIVTIRSSAGQRVVVDASQSAQTAGLYALGNTVGESSSTTRDARSISIRGDGIVSVGYSAGSLRISASQSVQPETQTFLGGLIASDKTYTSGTITLSGVGGGITVQSNAGQRIDLSVAAPVAQTDQTLGLYAVQNTTGQSSSTTRDARSLSVAGDGAVSVGYSAGSLRISAPTQSVQPGIQNLVASDATFSSGTVSISGFGAATVNTAANIIRISVPVQTAESQSIGMSNLGNTSGTTGIASGAQVRFLLAGGNNVTLSQSLNGASGTLTISAANQTVQTQNIVDVTLSGNTAGAMALISSGTMTLAGGNNITVSQAGNAVTISGPNVAGAQTGISGIIGSDATYTSGTVQFTGSNMVTVKSSAGQRIVIDASQSVQPGVQNLVASDATFSSGTVSISGFGDVTVNTAANLIRISAPTQTVESQSIGMSNVGNTSGTTGMASGGQVRFVFAGGNNITLSQSLNGASGTITISAPNLGAGAMSAGVSNLGNSGGATGITGTQLVLVGSNNITLSQTTGANGGTVSIIGGAGGGFSAGASTDGNTAGATGITGTQLVMVGSGPISLSQTTGANGGTLSINAPATSSLVGASGISISTNGSTISIMQTTGSSFITSLAPYDESPIVTGQQGQGSLHVAPFRVGEQLQFDRLALGLQMSNATNSSGSFTLSQWFGLYTKNASSISLLHSTSISTNFTGSGTAGSYSLYAGPGWLTVPWTTTVSEGDYYAAIISRSTSGGANHSLSQLLLSKFTNSAFSGIIGVASATSNQRLLGQGHYSATTSAFPASIAFSQLVGTGSVVMRSPVFMFRSGTV